MTIYQLFVRVFGNRNASHVSGTFNDVTDSEIERIKALGISHIWLTGVIRHSTRADYSDYGLKPTNPLITKGKAGSPYSIVDYYDVDPDLAADVNNRMSEFQAVVDRIHKHGLKVIMDFVPNHLAREYKSLQKPATVEDFGCHDRKNIEFDVHNNFYYCPGEKFVVPGNVVGYDEFPAKASGNDIFNPRPTANDWYDTVKLNYGVDYRDGSKHFATIPDTWYKMLDILMFWCSKGVDGFRVDMAEMVPVEFWRWSLYRVREKFNVTMIAEIYQPEKYRPFIEAGFDYLYDKVGLYNTLENIYRYGWRAETISDVWKGLGGIDGNMLRFMENHDEPRLASTMFMGKPEKAYPFVSLSALMSTGPFMIYNGQEYGEGGEGRTSIFDYVSLQSMTDNKNHADVYEFYSNLLNFRENSMAIQKGGFYDLMWANPWFSNFDPQYVYAFLRYYKNDRLLIVVNFNLYESRNMTVTIPDDAINIIGGCDSEYKVELRPGECKIIKI